MARSVLAILPVRKLRSGASCARVAQLLAYLQRRLASFAESRYVLEWYGECCVRDDDYARGGVAAF
jgi:hypothetical protein